uniref:Uncharacterized protein n=1 Tax=Leptospirillum sp. Group II '5-way CG' TaxID=419541 RepID=B6AQH8_9BACT|nr:MAG: Hypothetical protein CGL2_10954053 [Leptospirillum sp. Group II '5-way CG']
MENSFRKQETLSEAKHRGRSALLDPLPDLTHHGMERWKENVKEYFRAECNDILSEEEEDPELRARVLEAMKEGFSELIEEQHDVPIPDSAVDEAHAAKEHAFRKLRTS